MTQTTPAESIVAAVRSLDAKELNSGTTGNVSVRAGAGMLITPTGIRAELLRPDQIVEMSLDGQWSGPMRPSSEWSMHAAIYRAAPQANAVVHAHPDHCVAISCLRQGIPAFHYMIASFGGTDVRCAEYAPFGSPELGDAAVAALEGRNACLLANHGMICHGPDVETAVARALKLETLACQYVLATSIGKPVLLAPDEMQVVGCKYTTYGQQNPQADKLAAAVK